MNYIDEREKIKPKVGEKCFFALNARMHGPMRNRKQHTLVVPPDVERLLETVYRTGFDVWLVGGAIRDFLLGLPPKDWDLATEASPQDVIRLFPRVIPVGIRHDTVQVHTGEKTVEVTSCQTQGTAGIVGDLGRRDFTVNALAMGYPDKQIIDPFDGRRDLQAGILRAVGDARSRFGEDPLRTLRAGRFVSVYGFSIDENTFEALKDMANRLAQVAAERIREEMYKLLLGGNVFSAFEWMRRGGVLQAIFPEILEGYQDEPDRSTRKDIYSHLVRSVQLCPQNLRVRLAALFHDIGKPRVRTLLRGKILYPDHHRMSGLLAVEILTRWRGSGKTVREVVKLVEKHISTSVHDWTDAQIRRLMAETGLELLSDLLDLAYADRLSGQSSADCLAEINSLRRRVQLQIEAQPPLQIGDLAIDGNDLMKALSLNPGPRIGEILHKLHRLVLDDPTMNERRILLDYARKEVSTESFSDVT